jgi:hypothetical protein
VSHRATNQRQAARLPRKLAEPPAVPPPLQKAELVSMLVRMFRRWDEAGRPLPEDDAA